MELGNYLVVVVVIICLCVGYILKNVVSTDEVNKFIPLIVGVLGVVLNVWLNNWSVTPEIIAGGLISGLASTGMYELLNQFIKDQGNYNE